eukprot:NODE_250_length_2598_cov_9.676736_g228_i0.p1 GENE.NODE_250_length_2598_cov_9.676736_g228_i0~~NODE_250_length_2598_cov_9.676736_g228_i0.p1  ORF type:complete len:832 (+),score=139.58 NODE_250_length_2598_cov_9.676736_g228_i0:76-2496(+)
MYAAPRSLSPGVRHVVDSCRKVWENHSKLLHRKALVEPGQCQGNLATTGSAPRLRFSADCFPVSPAQTAQSPTRSRFSHANGAPPVHYNNSSPSLRRSGALPGASANASDGRDQMHSKASGTFMNSPSRSRTVHIIREVSASGERTSRQMLPPDAGAGAAATAVPSAMRTTPKRRYATDPVITSLAVAEGLETHRSLSRSSSQDRGSVSHQDCTVNPPVRTQVLRHQSPGLDALLRRRMSSTTAMEPPAPASELSPWKARIPSPISAKRKQTVNPSKASPPTRIGQLPSSMNTLTSPSASMTLIDKLSPTASPLSIRSSSPLSTRELQQEAAALRHQLRHERSRREIAERVASAWCEQVSSNASDVGVWSNLQKRVCELEAMLSAALLRVEKSEEATAQEQELRETAEGRLSDARLECELAYARVAELELLVKNLRMQRVSSLAPSTRQTPAEFHVKNNARDLQEPPSTGLAPSQQLPSTLSFENCSETPCSADLHLDPRSSTPIVGNENAGEKAELRSSPMSDVLPFPTDKQPYPLQIRMLNCGDTFPLDAVITLSGRGVSQPTQPLALAQEPSELLFDLTGLCRPHSLASTDHRLEILAAGHDTDEPLVRVHIDELPFGVQARCSVQPNGAEVYLGIAWLRIAVLHASGLDSNCTPFVELRLGSQCRTTQSGLVNESGRVMWNEKFFFAVPVLRRTPATLGWWCADPSSVQLELWDRHADGTALSVGVAELMLPDEHCRRQTIELTSKCQIAVQIFCADAVAREINPSVTGCDDTVALDLGLLLEEVVVDNDDDDDDDDDDDEA